MPDKKPTYQDLEKQIAELKSENKLKQTEDRFNALLQASEDMITIHKPDGKYIYYNGPTCYAITPKDIVGKMPNDLFDNDVSSTLLNAFKKVERTGVSETIEVLLDWLGEKRWFSEYIYPIKNTEGKIIELVKVCRDIHKRKIAELELEEKIKEKEKQAKELEHSKQKIQNTLELVKENEYSLKEAGRMAKIGYWRFDNLTETLFWSDALYQIYGSNPSLGVPTIDAILNTYSKDSRKLILESLEDLNKKGTPYDIELELTNFKNEKRWIRNIGEPIYNDNNEISGRRGISQDITQKKVIETNLDEKNKKLYELNNALNQAQKLSHVGSWQWNMITDEAEWSDEMYNIYGVSKDAFYPSNENVSKTVFLDDLHKVEQGISSLLIDKVFVPFEFRMKRPNGEIRHLYIEALEINNQETIFGVTKDITERKKIEEENLRIQENYIRLFQNASVSIWNEDFSLIFDEVEELRKIEIPSITLYLEKYPEVLFSLLEKLKVNKVNKATLKLFKAKSNEDFLNNITETFGEGADKVFIKLIEAIWNNEKSFTSEVNYKTLEGDQFLAIISVPIPSSRLEQKTVPVSIQSIQSIKDAELKYIESLNNLNEAQEIASVGSWSLNLSNNEIDWSDEVYRIWGFDKDKFAPKHETFIKRIHPDDLDLLNSALDLVYKKGIPYDIEFRICLPNNVEKTIRSICKPIFDDEQKVVRLKGTNQDITERKNIEEENLRIQENYKRLFNNATVSIWNQDFTELLEEIEELKKLDILDIKLYLDQNPEVLFSLTEKIKVNKVNKATLILFKAKSNKEFLSRLPETFGEGMEKVFEKFIKAVWNNEKLFSSEANYKTLTGEKFVGILSIPIPQTNKEQKIVPVSVQSIQSIKDAEFKIKDSLNKLNDAQKIVKIGSWFFYTITETEDWSDQMFEIWDFDSNKGTPEYEKVLQRIHKEDLELYNSSVNTAINKGVPYDIEFRIILPNDIEKTIRSICKPIFGENREVINLTGTNQDITEQKLIRNKIEKAEEMYRLLTDNSNDLICLQESDSSFKYISPSIKNLLGYDQSEFLGKKVFGIVHKDDVQRLKGSMSQNVFSSLNNEPFTLRVRHKEGRFVWFEFLTSPVYKDNKINYFVTSARDISQWMLAKQEIQEYQTSFQKMTTEMTLIEEKQKKEIASNIHDHLSQSLVISKMKINELKKNPNLKEIDEDLKFIEKHISEVLENSRKITYDLSPPVLYQLGIIDALNWLLENVEATHKIECIVISNESNIKLSDVKSILLFRCIQELVKNILKYAKASLIKLEININKQGINILLSDNGIGFNTKILNNYNNHAGSGFGLFAVQERIRNINGEFKIISKINSGTTVNIFIPLSK